MTMSQWSNEVQEAYRKSEAWSGLARWSRRRTSRRRSWTRAPHPSQNHMENLKRGAGSQGVRTPSMISASGTATRTRTPVQEGEPVEEEEAARDLHEAEHGEEWKDEKWEDWRKLKKRKQSGRAKSHQGDSGDDRSSGESLRWRMCRCSRTRFSGGSC